MIVAIKDVKHNLSVHLFFRKRDMLSILVDSGCCGRSRYGDYSGKSFATVQTSHPVDGKLCWSDTLLFSYGLDLLDKLEIVLESLGLKSRK
ncbi:hypothetical protein LB507_004824 [Fusarium sp. FIESC RH6]|nr:hypothetical protein LB507_004824 [Fusarium sp. FIESC RH6]